MAAPIVASAASLEAKTLSALQHREWHFRRLLEKLPAGAYTCDAEGLITYFNPHAVQLWGRAPTLNDPVDRFCGSFKLYSSAGEPISHDRCWMALALQTGNEYNAEEIVVERPDGRRLTVLAHASPIRDEAGRLLGAVNVLVDISDRKRAEEGLREADRAKNEFLATLAHELRNPLAPIANAVSILDLQCPDSPELRWALAIIDRQMAQMTRLIDDLLDLARITSNKLELREHRFELAQVLEAAVETSRPLIEECEQEFAVTFPSEPVYLAGDLTRLAQVVSNLLNNAAKYTPRDGRIWLKGERQGGEAVITVRDTGVGIASEALPNVFDMFMQGDRSLERSQGGLGIGLTLAKRLVDLHRGTLTASSGGPGQGSEFAVRLPVAVEPSRALQQAHREVWCADSPLSLRILVVDDNRDSAESLGVLLELRGHLTRTAHDGRAAIAAAEQFRPDVVLLDIGLPKLNGYDTGRTLRQQPWGKRTLLVAVTGWGQDADRERSREAGFDHHLVKPVDTSILVQLLDQAARGRHATQNGEAPPAAPRAAGPRPAGPRPARPRRQG